MIYTYRHLNFGTLKLAAMGIVPKSQPDQCMVVVWYVYVCAQACQYRKSLFWVSKRSVYGVNLCAACVYVCAQVHVSI